jgi:hypothetical protein
MGTMADLSDLLEVIEAVQGNLQPLKEGEFSEKINKVSMYLSTIGKNIDSFNSSLESINQQSGSDQDKYSKEVASRTTGLKASLLNSIRFARMNLDQAMAQALDKLIRRPKSANKTDEQKKMRSLHDWFDQIPDPATAMLEHFKASSNPLDKWLVAGQWGHEYLRKRHINPKVYDSKLCELIPCSDSSATRMIMSYGKLNRAVDAVEELISKTLKSINEALQNGKGKEPDSDDEDRIGA